jgi:hypothetical protein
MKSINPGDVLKLKFVNEFNSTILVGWTGSANYITRREDEIVLVLKFYRIDAIGMFIFDCLYEGHRFVSRLLPGEFNIVNDSRSDVTSSDLRVGST